MCQVGAFLICGCICGHISHVFFMTLNKGSISLIGSLSHVKARKFMQGHINFFHVLKVKKVPRKLYLFRNFLNILELFIMNWVAKLNIPKSILTDIFLHL